ncbi:hypothetical protein BGZ60DRAFT_535405 [Tricladium varicosporioides]|nr:hypothetical protein BGZ60DRAFT_535405 [Hymenoscyphus varicosporioides]
MPSRGNPNVPNKQRRIANRSKVQKKNSINKVSKNPRGTTKSNVLHPTSGPLAPVSGKKARKLERAQNKARRRAIEKAMEQEGEVEMTDIPKTTKPKTAKATEAAEDKMEMDEIS